MLPDSIIMLDMMYTGRRPIFLASGLNMNREIPINRITQAVACESVLTVTLSAAAISTIPGEIIGPYAPTTPADRPTISRMISLRHVGHCLL